MRSVAFDSHQVGQKDPNEWGLYDMIGPMATATRVSGAMTSTTATGSILGLMAAVTRASGAMAGGLIRDFGDPAADRGGLPVHQRKPWMVRVVKHNRMFVPVDKDGKRRMTLGSSDLPSTAGSMTSAPPGHSTK